MLPVEILPVQETIVLRARGSELLILPHHVQKLKGFTKPRDFSQYFRAEALVNRPARKLFEAWLRKDHTLWPRLYQTVHKEMEAKADDEGRDSEPVAKAEKPAGEAKAAAAPEPTPQKAAKKEARVAEEVEADEPSKGKKEKAAKKDTKPAKDDVKEKTEKPEKAAKSDKKVKAAKSDKAEKTPAKVTKAEKPEKAAKAAKNDKPKKEAKAEKPAKGKSAKAAKPKKKG